MAIVRNILAAAVVAGGLGLGFAPANAAALPGPAASVPVSETSTDQVEKAAYYRRHWRHRHRGPSIYFGFGPRRYGHYRRHHYNRGYW